MPGLLLVTPPGPEADALSAIFRERGYEVHQAGNGSAAVDVAYRRQPDVILLDPALSAMDRWHAVKRLHTEPATARIPVLTLVSDGDPAGLERVLGKIEKAMGVAPRPRVPPRTPTPLRPTRAVPESAGMLATHGVSPSAPTIPALASRHSIPPLPSPGRTSGPPSRIPISAFPSATPPGPIPATSPGRRTPPSRPPTAPPAASAVPVSAAPPRSPTPPVPPVRPAVLPPDAIPPIRVENRTPPTPAPRPSAPPAEPAPSVVDGPPPRKDRTPPAPEGRVIGGREPPTPAPPATSAPAPSVAPRAEEPATEPGAEASAILVVDDNAMNRDMLSRRLERKGYRVGVADSGPGALAALAATRYDAVLLDWMMPGMSGIEVLKEIRLRWSAIELPVIMATAKSEAEDVLEALRAEANDYVTKPLNFEVVHARLRTHLHLVEAHRELRASERRFRALLENTGDLIVQFRPAGEVTYVSPAVRTLLGIEPDTFAGRTFYDWLHPIDRRALEERLGGRAIPAAFTFIARMTRQDEGFLWVETSCRFLGPEDGGPLLQAACRDVTEHMERLAGDEPPLPLGGDILTHPAWRQPSSPTPSPAPSASPSPSVAAPVVVVVGEVFGTPEELARRVAEAVARARGER